MAALVVVTMGVFSSCKDYDDDINANTALINQLQTQVKALETAAAKAQADATKALQDAANAQAAADAAQKTANDALAKGEQGIADAAKAQAAADAAQAAADEAKAAAAQAKADALKALADEAARLDAAIAKKVDQTVFDETIAKLATKDELNAAIKRFDDELAAQVATLDGKITNLDTKIDEINKALKAAIDECVKKDDFQAAIAGLNEQIKALQDKDTELATLIKANADAIKVNSDSITSFAKYIKTFEAQIKANQAAIAALDKKFENYYTKDEVTAAITAAFEAFTAATIVPMQTQLDEAIAGVAANGVQIGLLQGRMDEVEKAIKKLNDEVIPAINEAIDKKADKSVVDLMGQAVQKNADDIKNLFDRMKVVEEEAAKIAGILTRLGKVEEDLKTLQDANLPKRVADLEAYKAELEKELKAIGERFDADEADIETLKGQMKTLLEVTIPAIQKDIETLQKNVQTIVKFSNKNITSLVTVPDEWLYGLPKIDADVIAAQDTYTFQFKNGTDVVTPSTQGAESGYAFALTANYWLNPSVADWKEYTYTMNEVAAQSFITRGNEDKELAGIKAIDTEKDVTFKDGILTVHFQFEKGENVNNAITKYDAAYLTDGTQTDGTWNEHWLSQGDDAAYSVNPTFAWTTTVALQATRNNTEDETALGLANNRVVTSDYAIVAPNYITALLLGNSKYEATGHGDQGNQKWHLWTSFDECKAENFAGVYGFEKDRDDYTTIDLNDYIDTHYSTPGKTEKENTPWDYAKIKAKGFDYKYTLLTNTDVWEITNGSEIGIKEGQGTSANTGYEKAAIVRVELIADGKTYAYGYVSILMKNKENEVEIEIPELVLKCVKTENDGYEDFAATYDWADFIDAINEALGQEIDWSLANFVVIEEPKARANAETTAAAEPLAGPYKKFKNKNSADADENTQGTIFHNEDDELLVWSFTEEEAIAAFYKEDGETPADVKNYKALIKIEPTKEGEKQGVAPMWITITIGEVVYPQATFGFDQRILRYWFTEQGVDNPEENDLAGRYEVHGSVEVVGQKDANDEFNYDFSATFRKNTFTATAAPAGWKYADEYDYSDNNVTAYFDASKYYVLPDGIKTKDEMKNYPATSTAVGASGKKYLLYLKSAEDNVLRAVVESNGKFRYENTQEIVVLGGLKADGTFEPKGTDAAKNITNYVAKFHEYTYFDGNNAEKYSYAYDLLNAADHKVLKGDPDKEKITFTTHMILKVTDYCLPIKYIGEGNRFDIRYLRPISIDNLGDYTVYDAVDGAYDPVTGAINYNSKTMIYLADIVKFIDWRDIKFAVNADGMRYVNYYGIKAIHPNFNEAMCDLDGKFELISDVTDKLKFSDETIGRYDETATSVTLVDGTVKNFEAGTAEAFKHQIGYFLYENNSSVVETFHIQLPITIEYHWGVTAPETITITVVRTVANARR